MSHVKGFQKSSRVFLLLVFSFLIQDFGVDSFNLGDVLKGVVRFTGVTSPIDAAHVSMTRQAGVFH